MSDKQKKRSIIGRAKIQARKVYNEGVKQGHEARASGGIGHLWRNYIDAIMGRKKP